MKLLIIGSVASGKTTLAKKLKKKYNIKMYEIDSIVHNDKYNVKRTVEEQQAIITKINEKNEWIIEGTLRKKLYNLLDFADKIIYVNTPLKKRKIRIITRYIKQKLKLEKCNYKPTLEMLKNMYKWTNDFEKNRKEFEEKLKEYNDKLIILKNEDV